MRTGSQSSGAVEGVRRESPEAAGLARGLEEAACALCDESAHDIVHAGCPDRLLRVPGRFDVVRCRGCGLARTNPRPTREAIGAYYPDSYAFFTVEQLERGAAYGILRSAIRVPYRLRYGDVALEPPAPGRPRLLDIGSGAGHLLEDVAALGWEPWGVEPNADLARRTAERLGLPEHRVVPGAAEDTAFPEESFDFVTMGHVLEHLHDPRAVLENVNRWLAPGGRLRIWLPNFGSLESRVFRHLWQGLDLPRHLYHFSPATLRALLRETGFQVDRVIPQWQGNMLTGSVTYALDALRGRARVYSERRALHYGLLPAAAALLALGEGGCLDVTARKRSDDERAAAA